MHKFHIQRDLRYNIFSICKLKPYSNKRSALSEMVTDKILGKCAISMHNNYPITFKHTEICFWIHYVILTFYTLITTLTVCMTYPHIKLATQFNIINHFLLRSTL